MVRRSITIICILAFLCLLAWLYRSLPVGHIIQGSEHKEQGEGLTGTSRALQAMEDSSPAIRSEQGGLAGGARQLEVVVSNSRLERIRGASVFLDHGNKRNGLRSGASTTTDANGLALVSRERASACKDLCVYADGYLPYLGTAPNTGTSRLEVTLLDGLSKGFFIHDSAGMPVAGCRVAMSAAALPLEVCSDLHSDTVALGNAQIAIYSSVSDSVGRCTLSGLAAGRYQFQVEAEGYVLAQQRVEAVCDVPGQDEDIELWRLLACVVQVVGDRVTAHGFSYPNYRIVGTAEAAVARAQSELEGKYPGSYVGVAAHDSTASPEKVKFTACLEKHGRHVENITMSPVTSVEPVVVDVSNDPVAVTVPVSFHVMDGGGHELRAFDAYLIPEEDRQRDVYIPLRIDEQFLITPGAYRIGCNQQFVRGHYSPTTIEAPASTTIVLDRVFRPCEIVVRDGSGRTCEQFGLTIISGTEQVTSRVNRAEPLSTWLPIGTAVIRVTARGFDPKEVSVDVEDAGMSEVQHIVVEVGSTAR